MYFLSISKTILVSLALLVLTISTPGFAGDPAGEMSLSDGVYTKSQAKSGKKLYKKHCVSCHEKGYFEPVLLTWQGQSAATLFGLMTAAMPESAPGSLTSDEYAEIFAYILKETGYPASTEALEPNSEKFAAIIITPPG